MDDIKIGSVTISAVTMVLKNIISVARKGPVNGQLFAKPHDRNFSQDNKIYNKLT